MHTYMQEFEKKKKRVAIKLPSKENLFCQDERAHNGNNYHHQGAKGSCKDRSFFLYHQPLDIV